MAIQGLAASSGLPLVALAALVAHLAAAGRASASCENAVGTHSWQAAVGAVLATTATAVASAPSASREVDAAMSAMQVSAPLMEVPVGWETEVVGGRLVFFPVFDGVRGQSQPDWPSEEQIVQHTRRREEGAPPPLPEGWLAQAVAEGGEYYWHEATGATQWERPTAEDTRRVVEAQAARRNA